MDSEKLLPEFIDKRKERRLAFVLSVYRIPKPD